LLLLLFFGLEVKMNESEIRRRGRSMDLDAIEIERDVDRYADERDQMIQDQRDIPAASFESLRRTYVALTGFPADPEWCQVVLGHKVSMAILSGIDARGHMGVKPGQKIFPATYSEVVNWAPMVMQLNLAADRQRELSAPKPTKAERIASCVPKSIRPHPAFLPLPGGPQVLHPGGSRAKVYNALKEMGRATIPELDEKLGFPTRAIVNILRRLDYAKEVS
jgi:hypothetical protein